MKKAKKKIGTILDEALYRRTKVEALRQDARISEVISRALEAYLSDQGSPPGAGGVVAGSWGAIPLEREVVEAVLEEEESYPEAR